MQRCDDNECQDTDAMTYDNTRGHARPRTNRRREIDIVNDHSCSCVVVCGHACWYMSWHSFRGVRGRHRVPLPCHGRVVLSLDFWLLGFFCWPCRNTTRAPRSSCVVQEIVEAGATTGGKSRETRGKTACNGPPRGIVGRVFLLGVDSTTMPLTAHD